MLVFKASQSNTYSYNAHAHHPRKTSSFRQDQQKPDGNTFKPESTRANSSLNYRPILRNYINNAFSCCKENREKNQISHNS
jgi:hypothetical protein